VRLLLVIALLQLEQDLHRAIRVATVRRYRFFKKVKNLRAAKFIKTLTATVVSQIEKTVELYRYVRSLRMFIRAGPQSFTYQLGLTFSPTLLSLDLNFGLWFLTVELSEQETDVHMDIALTPK